MQGIYLITNKLNNQKYIGQSKNISARWSAHRRNANNKKEFKSCSKLYNAFEKYGVDNFIFSVIEEVKDPNKLTKREIYWIKFYNTIESGYNSMLPDISGTLNPKHKLQVQDVLDIQNELSNSKILISELATKYDVQVSTIYRINRGETWYNSELSYPIRTWTDEARPGSQNGRSDFTEEEVLQIRKRYVNETVNDMYPDYKNRCSLSGFKKIVQGTTFKNVPIYKKSMKKWINP